MDRWLVLTMPLLVALAALSADEKAPSEQALLTQLKKLAAPPEKTELRDLDADERREFMVKRAQAALKTIGEFETRFPNSTALPEARSEALKAVDTVDDETVTESAAKLAAALRDNSPKGSDYAAQADLYLAGQKLHKALRGITSVDEFRTAWQKNVETLRKDVEDYLTTYPNYRPGADAVAVLARMAEMAGDEKTERFLVALVEKHQPEHPLARAAARHRAVGKAFDFTYTPVGLGRPAHLKDLRGKVVVVYFWAVWCVPCKAESKRLTELYERYHKDGLEVIAVSLDEKEERVPRFMKVNKIEWPNWVGESARKFAAEWGVDSLPTQFVIDRAGRLRNGDAVGKLEEILPGLLKEHE
jgi:thiol-disulfide isomerase/thioredoxin